MYMYVYAYRTVYAYTYSTWIYVCTCIYAKYVYCSIFGPYTFIYDIQFHIRAYTDISDMQVH